MPEHLRGAVRVPVDAAKEQPQAYRDLSRRLWSDSGMPSLTVRACLPFHDALAEGVVVPLPFDLRLNVADEGRSVEWQHSKFDATAYGMSPSPVSAIGEQQISGLIGRPVLKIETPYYARTRRGTSLLVVEPLNRFEPLRAVSGIIDTDRASGRLNAMVWWSGDDGDYFLPAGTPLLQLIALPRRRGRRSLAYLSKSEIERRRVLELRTSVEMGAYLRYFRASRGYKNER